MDQFLQGNSYFPHYIIFLPRKLPRKQLEELDACKWLFRVGDLKRRNHKKTLSVTEQGTQ